MPWIIWFRSYYHALITSCFFEHAKSNMNHASCIICWHVWHWRISVSESLIKTDPSLLEPRVEKKILLKRGSIMSIYIYHLAEMRSSIRFARIRRFVLARNYHDTPAFSLNSRAFYYAMAKRKLEYLATENCKESTCDAHFIVERNELTARS